MGGISDPTVWFIMFHRSWTFYNTSFARICTYIAFLARLHFIPVPFLRPGHVWFIPHVVQPWSPFWKGIFLVELPLFSGSSPVKLWQDAWHSTWVGCLLMLNWIICRGEVGGSLKTLSAGHWRSFVPWAPADFSSHTSFCDAKISRKNNWCFGAKNGGSFPQSSSAKVNLWWNMEFGAPWGTPFSDTHWNVRWRRWTWQEFCQRFKDQTRRGTQGITIYQPNQKKTFWSFWQTVTWVCRQS